VHHLTVRKFGPIENAELDVARFLLFIGPQASGKSTLAKLIYYFLHVRDEVVRFIRETASGPESDQMGPMLKARLRRLFSEFFGSAPQPEDMRIEYRYSDEFQLTVALDRSNGPYVDAQFSNEAEARIADLVREARALITSGPVTTPPPSELAWLAVQEERSLLAKTYVVQKCQKLFGCDKNLLFIPAGRSTLSILSEQFQGIRQDLLDYPMRRFVRHAGFLRKVFGAGLDVPLCDPLADNNRDRPRAAIRKAREYVTGILKGEYIHDDEGGKLLFAPGKFTKISYASSGQQEAVWILLSLLAAVLEKSGSFLMMIEEPEAHLYPDAQKAIVEFIAFVFNVVKCDFIITTHSPYVMSYVNDLLYAEELGREGVAEEIRSVIPEDLWIDANETAGYFVDKGTVRSMMDRETSILDWDGLDSASDDINEKFDRMADIKAASNAKQPG
jgi:energy-coupling factor transporter ATP-binding protein EcfA2